jgi:hypothetical protein
MGEVNPTPEVAARVVEDLTALEVDPAKGEHLYKAALIQSNRGASYRLLAKSLKSGKLDLVHYGCDLDDEGKPVSKWRIRRILEQSPERFEKELADIQAAVRADGEEVAGVWIHDMTGIADLATQGSSLDEWSQAMAREVKKRPS